MIRYKYYDCDDQIIIMIVMISYGGAAAVPDRSIVSALTGVYLDSLYYLGPAGRIFFASLLLLFSPAERQLFTRPGLERKSPRILRSVKDKLYPRRYCILYLLQSLRKYRERELKYILYFIFNLVKMIDSQITASGSSFF